MDDDLARELRNYVSYQEKRDRIRDQQHRDLLEHMRNLNQAVTDGFLLISNTMLDINRR